MACTVLKKEGVYQCDAGDLVEGSEWQVGRAGWGVDGAGGVFLVGGVVVESVVFFFADGMFIWCRCRVGLSDTVANKQNRRV